MKTSELTVGKIYVSEKNTYGDHGAVMVLDNKLWSIRDYHQRSQLREAEKGERPSSGNWRNGHRTVGVPVLWLNQRFQHWTDDVAPEHRVMDSVDDIMKRAFKKLGIKQLSELVDIEEAPRFVKIIVTMGNGKKAELHVHLVVVRPQTITSTWDTFVSDKMKAKAAQDEFDEQKRQREARVKQTTEDVTARLNALLGHMAPTWDGTGRRDCKRLSSTSRSFEISEETLLKLLAMAEQSQQ